MPFHITELRNAENLMNYKEKILHKFKCRMAFDVTENPCTFDKNTLIDWCLINDKWDDKNIDCQVYESYFSDHKPIFFNYKI